MKMLSIVPGTIAAYLCLSMSANASTLTEDFSGFLGSNSVSGTIDLDVVGGQAVSGTGTFTGFGLTNVPIVLITSSTPDNETSPGPVGYRANDGTDLGGADTTVPIDSSGLLFDVDTSTAAFDQYPLLGLSSAAGDSVFTGNVSGTEYYYETGTLNFAATPLPATFYIFAAGLFVVGYFGYRRNDAN
jgi:hypothetical protein